MKYKNLLILISLGVLLSWMYIFSQGSPVVNADVVYLEKDIRSIEILQLKKEVDIEYVEIGEIKNIVELDLELSSRDYYWGKFENAEIATNQLNKISYITIGDKISLLEDNYLILSRDEGYLTTSHGLASGICWSVSVLGGVMDLANDKFYDKYGIDLFVFEYGDRAPHSKFYYTYKKSNYGHGYTVYRHYTSRGYYGQDYTFQINPEIENIDGLENMIVKIELVAQKDNPKGYMGKSINTIVQSNIDF